MKLICGVGIFGSLVLVGLAGCSDAVQRASESNFNVKVTVIGLSGSGLQLRNNGVDALDVVSNGIQQFSEGQSPGTEYTVAVAQQPVHLTQTCTVENGSGQMQNADVDNVIVRCIDNVAPQVIQIDPPANAPSVDPDSAITVTFDDPIASLELGWFVVRNATGVAVSGTFDFPAPNQVRFNPTESLLLSSIYSVTLGAAIKDLSGNALSNPITQQFSTRDGRWGAISYRAPSDGSFTPTINALNNGNINLVWITSSIGVVSLHAQSYSHKTKSWSAISTAPQPDGISFSVSRGTGSLTVVGPLSNSVDNTSPIMVIDLINGNWAPNAIDISNTSQPLVGNNTKNFVSAVSNANGGAAVMWLQSGMTSYQVRGNVYGKDGWSSEAHSISAVLSDGTRPAMALDNNGRVIVFWQEGDASMKAQHYSRDTGWENSARKMGKAFLYGADTMLVSFDQFGNAIATWVYNSRGGYEIAANYYQNSPPAGWLSTEGITVRTSSAQQGSNPSVHFDQSGNAHMIWTGPVGLNVAYRQLVSSHFSVATKTWSTPSEFLIQSSDLYQEVALASGDVIVVYGNNNNSSSSRLHAARLSKGIWSPVLASLTQPLSTIYTIGRVSLSANASQVLAAWTLHEPASTNPDSIWVNLYSANSWSVDPFPIKLPSVDKVVDVYATLDEYGNALVTWGVEVGVSAYDWFAIRYVHGTWQSEPKKLNNIPILLHPDLYVDKTGAVTAIWFEGNKLALRRFE